MTGENRCTSALPDSLTGAKTVAYLPEVDSLLRAANLVALQASTVCFWYQYHVQP